jgi:hypothetical protein
MAGHNDPLKNSSLRMKAGNPLVFMELRQTEKCPERPGRSGRMFPFHPDTQA